MRAERARAAADAAADERAARTGAGPRHAAPRRPLLTKLQVPAGKAIAIAAMPTAVLLGMGLTPRFAQADELPASPFTGRACADGTPDTSSAPVSSPSATQSRSSGSAGSGPADSGPAASRSSAPAAGEAPATSRLPDVRTASWTRRTAPSVSGSRAAGATGTGTAGNAGNRRETGPQDPPGGGQGLAGLLRRGGSGISAGPSPSATTERVSSSGSSSRAVSQSSSRSSSRSSSGRSSASTAERSAEGPGTAGRTPGTAGRTAENTTRTATGTATPSGAAATGSTSPAASATGGTTPYPCPTYDARALADAQDERTPALLPDEPWTLETDLLTLHGLDYQGVVRVRTHDGTVKNVLKFTADSVDIRNLHQITEGAAGRNIHVQAARGSTSTFRGGTVTMYTQSLKGNLYGLIPVTFTPETPPPLNVSEVFFTDVTVIQAGQFGGTLTIPGMHLYQTDN